MVDISKHLQRAQQAIERRNYDLAIEICLECQEIAPPELEVYRKLLDAAKRRIKETGKKGGMSLGFGSKKDPHKALSAAVKRASKNPDDKACAAAGDAAKAVYESGDKKMVHVAVLFYEEVHSSGLFNAQVLWDLGHMYHGVYSTQKQAGQREVAVEALKSSIDIMSELDRGMPGHKDAGRTARQWQAILSMESRGGGDAGVDGQLASSKEARRNEVINRVIRTKEDAKEVLAFIDEDIKENPDDKRLWLKRGDVLKRVNHLQPARDSYLKAQQLDPHDFVITKSLGEIAIKEAEVKVKVIEQRGEDTQQAKVELLNTKVEQYQAWAERQPTEMSHKFYLSDSLYKLGRIDDAASGFQQAVKDPRFRRSALNYLGHCFRHKNLLDIAKEQFNQCLELIEDELSDEYKEVRYQRGICAEENGDTEEAVADFRKVVELDLGFRDAADRLARLRQK